MQPEGDRNFKGVREGISTILKQVDCPVIVKETGAGISGNVARDLLQLGVQVIDVAGAGGTSWSRVENLRERTQNPLHQFDDWGIPTVDCLIEMDNLRSDFSFELIASGGIRNSFDIAKSIALGADFTASAQPLIKALFEYGEEGLDTLLDSWIKESRILLTLLGCERFSDLKPSHLRSI
jgi:isopentenyl-diphosphate delta-isomerase